MLDELGKMFKKAKREFAGDLENNTQYYIFSEYPDSVQNIFAAAEKGDPKAFAEIGYLYQKRKEYSISLAWYEAATERNFVQAAISIRKLCATKDRYGNPVDSPIPPARRAEALRVCDAYLERMRARNPFSGM